MKKWQLILLSLLVAGAIKATEVYVCEWVEDVYGCYLISAPEKPEPPIVVTEPEPEEPTVYDY